MARLRHVGDGHDLFVCSCAGGPYIGARKAGTPDCCEGCGLITQAQLDALANRLVHDARAT